MRKILLLLLVVILTVSTFAFMGVEAANVQEAVFELHARLDAGLISVMYPLGTYNIDTGFTISDQFNLNALFLGLNLDLPLGGIHLRAAAYTTVGDIMDFSSSQQLNIYGRVGAGIDILFIRLEGGVQLYYLFGDPDFEFSFDPSHYYIAVGLAF